MDDIPYGYCHCGCGEKTLICAHTNTKRGLRKGEPCQFIKGHHGDTSRPAVERFWESVQPGEPDECWLWKNTDKPNNIHHISLGSRNGHCMLIGAHVFAAELAYGPKPEGLQVNHHCDVPACCNPQHLYYGTQDENMRDMVVRRRARWLPSTLHHFSGEKAVGAKLSDDEAVEVIHLRRCGIRAEAVASLFNISPAHVYHLTRGLKRPSALARYLRETHP